MKVSKRFFICILLLFVSWCVMMVSSCLSFRSLSFLIGTRTTPRRISSSRIFASSSAIEKQQQSLEQQYDRTTMATNTSGADMNDRQFSTSTSQQQEQPNQNKNIIPRAAAAVTLQCGSHFLLIQRGKPPNKGHWSLPGGKTEAGETSMVRSFRSVLPRKMILCTSGTRMGFSLQRYFFIFYSFSHHTASSQARIVRGVHLLVGS